LHLAYRWFCKLDLDDEIPHHSTLSANRLGRYRESDLLRHIFERVVWAAMATGCESARNFDPTPSAENTALGACVGTRASGG
jgi:transposase